jgi:hypothetical protein
VVPRNAFAAFAPARSAAAFERVKMADGRASWLGYNFAFLPFVEITGMA